MQWKDRLDLNSLSYTVVSDFGLYHCNIWIKENIRTRWEMMTGLILKQNLLEIGEGEIRGVERSRRRIDAFELWCWRRLLRVPWTARTSNQSILKEIGPECSSEGLMLKLKLQYFGHLMRRADSLEKTPMLGKIEGRRRRGQEDEMAGWHHRLNGREFEWTLGVGDGQGSLACCSPGGRKESDTAERLNWVERSKKCFGSLMCEFSPGPVWCGARQWGAEWEALGPLAASTANEMWAGESKGEVMGIEESGVVD